MASEDGKGSSTDENKSSTKSTEEEHKIRLEEEIKKIISGLDVRFEDSTPPEEAETIVPSAVLTGSSKFISSDLLETVGSPRLRESTCTSAATTVVNQRVPPKISVAHLKSGKFGGDTQQQHYQQQPQSLHGAQYVSGNYIREGGFYQPERDEVTEPTLSETLPSTTENTFTTNDGCPTSPQQNQGGWLPPVREESGICPMYGSPTNYNDPNRVSPMNFSATNNHHVNPSNYAPEIVNLPRYQSPYQPEYIPQEYLSGHPDALTPPQLVHQNLKENVDRYNSTHMTYTPMKESGKPRRSITNYLVEKGRNMFNRRDDSDSGEVIPQLYKARVKNSICPQRFTFKAVTGAPSSGCQCKSAYYHPSYTVPSFCKGMTQCRAAQDQAPMYAPAKLPSHDEPCACFTMQECATREKKGSSKTCENAGSNKEGIKSKAYYTDLGCGYVSQGSVPEKVDIYCFDQLNTGFFRTSDHPPPLFTDIAIQRTERYATVFWAEIFGIVNIFTAFIIAMFLQTFKFILQGVLRPILIGFVQLLSDYLIKPLLTLLYNGFTQPISIFLYNVIASVRDIMQPLAKGLSYFVELVAVVLRAIRLVEVRNVTNISPCGPQSVKY